MADNSAVTKDDLQSALSSVVAQLTRLIQETAVATETKLIVEMDRRFAESQNAINKRFRSADRQRRAFREEVENRFHEIRGMIISRFDEAKEYTDAAVVEKIRELKALLDGQAGMASRSIPNNKLSARCMTGFAPISMQPKSQTMTRLPI